ncbi:hypothetical protein HPB52_014845 [Rhipicephalus sanguineus]|uniref:Endonuclease/exonuclease/phosphatase domain-containing protein n=1 Tax=Rhipicephalus sanguineus TaxID=34632 RepID=A0A9D4SV23_RHISA|nr:hypothetical protein HPB52_014845 [Rhipicephalus sanguineus]
MKKNEIGPKPVKLQGYYALLNPDFPRVATLVSKSITAKADYLEGMPMNHQIISLLPQKRGKAVTLAGSKDRLVALGDFNAPNTAWGYGRDSPKGLETTT